VNFVDSLNKIEYFFTGFLYQPGDFGFRKIFPQKRKSREGMDDIPKGTES
jgi:hypothetical protein